MRITSVDFDPQEGDFLDQDLLVEEVFADGTEGERVVLPARTMVDRVRYSETKLSSVSEFTFWTPSREFWRVRVERMRPGRGWLITTRVALARLHRAEGDAVLMSNFTLPVEFHGWRGQHRSEVHPRDEGRTIKIPPGGWLQVSQDKETWERRASPVVLHGGARGLIVRVLRVYPGDPGDIDQVTWMEEV